MSDESLTETVDELGETTSGNLDPHAAELLDRLSETDVSEHPQILSQVRQYLNERMETLRESD